MPLRDNYDLEPWEPDFGPGTGSGGGTGSGDNTIPPASGTSSSPWPSWAIAIDSNVQGWRTLDDGHLLHKATNRVYSPSGTFVAPLSDYLAGVRDDTGMNPEGPPAGGIPGQRWTDPDTGEVWQFYLNLGWMNTTADPKNPNEIPPYEEGGLGPPGTLPPGSPDPGDGPVPAGPLPVTWNPPAGWGDTDYIGIPPPSNSNGPGQTNPMPQMPGMGVWSTAPHLSISRNAEGQPTGQQEQFKPWGQPMGAVSQALRYGGPPTQTQTGGFGARAVGSQEWNQPGITWDNGVLKWGDKTWDAAFGGWISPTTGTTAAATSAALRGEG